MFCMLQFIKKHTEWILMKSVMKDADNTDFTKTEADFFMYVCSSRLEEVFSLDLPLFCL